MHAHTVHSHVCEHTCIHAHIKYILPYGQGLLAALPELSGADVFSVLEVSHYQMYRLWKAFSRDCQGGFFFFFFLAARAVLRLQRFESPEIS